MAGPNCQAGWGKDGTAFPISLNKQSLLRPLTCDASFVSTFSVAENTVHQTG
jgi:hypothetical protein